MLCSTAEAERSCAHRRRCPSQSGVAAVSGGAVGHERALPSSGSRAERFGHRSLGSEHRAWTATLPISLCRRRPRHASDIPLCGSEQPVPDGDSDGLRACVTGSKVSTAKGGAFPTSAWGGGRRRGGSCGGAACGRSEPGRHRISGRRAGVWRALLGAAGSGPRACGARLC